MTHKARLLLALPLIAMLALACQTSELAEPIGEEIPDEPVLIAIDAFRGNDQYFLRYRRGREVFYAAGDLNINTITPGVTDAAVLSVLWTLNVDFVQGEFLQAPQKELNYDFSSM